MKTKSGFKIKGLRWVIFAFFVVVMIFNYIDRSSISIGMPLIAKQFHLSTVSSGIVLSAFFWSYTLMQIPGSWLVDKLKPHKIVGSALCGWGIVEAVTGFANTFNVFLWCRILLGIFEGPVQVGCNNSTLRWLRPEERGRGSTIIDSGGPLGSAIGGVLVTGLIMWLGSWQIAFIFLGVLTVLVGIAAFVIMRDDPSKHPWITKEEAQYLEEGHKAELASEQKSVAVNQGSILRNFKSITPWMFLLAFAAYDAVQYGLMTWAPYYITNVRHVSFGMTGVATFIIFAGGFAGELLVGQFADHWRKTGAPVNRVMKTLFAIAGIAVTICTLLINKVAGSVMTIALLTVACFFVRWGGLYWSVPQLIVFHDQVGRISGAMNFAGNIAGIAVPIVVGWIAQVTGSFNGVFVMFAVCGVVMAISSCIINYSHKLGAKTEQVTRSPA